MDFYRALSAHYDTLFPANAAQLDFLRARLAGRSTVLDVAAGTGNQALALAREGFAVTAVDLDAAMVEAIDRKATAAGVDIATRVLDMADIEALAPAAFDAVLCLGNSLVHLATIDDIGHTLRGFAALLAPAGVLILQVVNYDRIHEQRIEQLPTIERPSVRFERTYDHLGGDRIAFHGKLTAGDETFEHTVPLLGLRSGTLVAALRDAGFVAAELLGAYDGATFDPPVSPGLIVVARKAAPAS